MEQVENQALLLAIANSVKDHIVNKLNQRPSILSTKIGVSHPTSAKILSPDKEGSDGVAIKHWFAAMAYCGILNNFVSHLERKASRWHRPTIIYDENSPEEAVERIVHLAQSFNANTGLNTNNIGYLIGVSFTTARAMNNNCTNSGGIAIKSWLRLFERMEVLEGIENNFITIEKNKEVKQNTPLRNFNPQEMLMHR